MANKEFHPVVLYSEDAQRIYEALVLSGNEELALKVGRKSKRTKLDKKYVSALNLYDEGTFNVDDNPVVSKGKDGAYVMVWQWISRDEI